MSQDAVCGGHMKVCPYDQGAYRIMESLWNPGQTLDKAKGTRKQEIEQKVTPRPCLLNAGLLIPVIPVWSSLRLQTPILQLFCFWPMETGSLLLSRRYSFKVEGMREHGHPCLPCPLLVSETEGGS